MSPNRTKRPAWEELDLSFSRQSLESKHQQKRAKLFTGCDPFNAEAANAINGMFDRVIAIASSHIPHLAKTTKPRLTPLDSNDPHKPQGRDTIAAPTAPWRPMTHAEKEARALEIGPSFQSDSSVVELVSSDDEIEDQDHEQDEEAEYSEENFDPDVEEESVQYNDEMDEYDENNPIQFEDTDEASETENTSEPAFKDHPEHVALSLVPEYSKSQLYQEERYSDQGSSPLEGSSGDYDEGLDDKDLNDEDVVDDEESDYDPVNDEAKEYSEGDYDDEEEELRSTESLQGDLPATSLDPYVLLDSDDEDALDSQEPDAPGDEYDEQGEDYGRDEEYDEQTGEYDDQDEEDDKLGERDGHADDYDDQVDIEPQDARYDTGDVQYSSLDDQDTQASVDIRLSDITVETVELEEQDVMTLEEDSYTDSSSQVYFESSDAISHNLVTTGDMDMSGDQMQSDTPDIQFPVARDVPVAGEYIYTRDTFPQPNQYLTDVHPVQNQTSLSATLATHDMDDVHLLANFLEVHQDAGSRIEIPASSHSQDVDAVVVLEGSVHYGEPLQLEERIRPEEAVQFVETIQLKGTTPHEEAVQHKEADQHEEAAPYEETAHEVSFQHEESVDHYKTMEEMDLQHEASTQSDEVRHRAEFNQDGANHHDVPSPTKGDTIAVEVKDDGTTSQQVETSNILEAISEASEEPQESPRNARLMRSGTMVITAREGRAFVERQERQEGTSVEGRTRKAHSAPTMMTRRTAASESHLQAKDAQEDELEASSSSPRFLPEAEFDRSTPPSTSVRRGGVGEVDLLVKEAREFCGRVSPASRTGSSPSSLGGHYPAPIIAPPPFGHAVPSLAPNADASQGYVADFSGEWSRDAQADTPPKSVPALTTTPTKRGVVDLAEENVIQSTVVGSHALRKFIHPPASMGASSHGTNTHSSGQAQSRSSSLEPAISPRIHHSNSMFSFGQNPLGLSLGAPPAPPAFGSVSVSPPAVSVGYGFGSTIAPGGAVAHDQEFAPQDSLGSEEPLYPVLEDDSAELNPATGLESHEGDEAAQAEWEQEGPEEEGGASDEEVEAPETGSSSSSPLFVLKTKKKKSPAQVKARNKARRVAAKNQKSAKAQSPV
ncbi:hypothetical protein BGZ92_002696 [Podila epicladia]|nr:hypothetical protein BGZ92_002696 [Podila epicladia]